MSKEQERDARQATSRSAHSLLMTGALIALFMMIPPMPIYPLVLGIVVRQRSQKD